MSLLPGHDGVPLEDSAEELYEHAPCGYLSTTPDGTIVRANATFGALVGRAPEELVGRRFPDLLTAGGRIYHETHYAPLLRMQGSVREIAVDLVRADGVRVPVLVNAVVRRREDGEPASVRVAAFDATERRGYEQELLRARHEAERAEARARQLAETLQASLIPPELPEVPRLELGAVYRAAGRGDEVGGDFYDVFEVARGDWAVVIGDVCGKGPEAAAVTAIARYTLRAAALHHRRPAAVLRMLNEVLLRQEVERFCTVAYVRLQQRADGRFRATVAAGGHPCPILLRAEHEPVAVCTPGGLVGVLPDVELHDVSLALAPGDALVLYTDGVTEARRGDELFGDDRLEAVLAEHRDERAVGIAKAVADAAAAFAEGPVRDDVAVLVVRVRAHEQRPG